MKKLVALTPEAAAKVAAVPSRKKTKFINDAIEAYKPPKEKTDDD